MNNKIRLFLAGLAAMFATVYASAADYADVGAAVDAVEAVPALVSPVFLAFVTLGVGVFTIVLLIRYAKKGARVG